MIFLKLGNSMLMTSYLDLIGEKINKLKSRKYKAPFSVPGIWLEKEAGKFEVNPWQYFLDRLDRIKEMSKEQNTSNNTLVYNMFIRLSGAYDHDSDNELLNIESRIKETGTFLKAISILPYLKSLGVNIIYLLPVASIGEDERKGNMGSPYSIKNPYKLDENLSENLLGLDVETEFKAFSEAVHLLGMKLVCEFVFRTSSIDSDLALEHPDWFYWINAKVKNRQAGDSSEAKYGPPIFLKKELEVIKQQVNDGNFNNLLHPHEQFRKLFAEVPKKVARVEGKIRGLLADKKTEVRIPGAFADWPPDDTQPAWSDVTFLRLYDNPKFNYIAYNTIRMYDNDLAKAKFKVKDLWDFIQGIIPHYIKEYDIDGVMIDMGHALPSELRRNIVSEAIKAKPEFFFWEENFSLDSASKEDGYSAVLGYLPFDAHRTEKLRDLIRRFESNDIPVNFFATGETHNTPRSFARIPEIAYLKCLYTFCHFLPALSFIHSGFELAESQPVNTGLGFTNEEIDLYTADKLGLFSSVCFNWDNRNNIIDEIKNINKIKESIIPSKDSPDNCNIRLLHSSNEMIVSYVREDETASNTLIFIANFSDEEFDGVEIYLNEIDCNLLDLVTGQKIAVSDGKICLSFQAYHYRLLKVI